MVLERIEPFGEMAAEKRHGLALAVLANVHRDAKRRPDPYVPGDFTVWERHAAQSGDAQLLQDPAAHARLIKQKLFGRG